MNPWTIDNDMLLKIESAGLTVEEFGELRKKGKLTPELKKAWNEYQRKLEAQPGENYFPAIQARVRAEFPEFGEGAVRHAANKITNEIRRGHFDCYYIEVSHAPLDNNGYYVHFEVEASGVTVYVRVTVD